MESNNSENYQIQNPRIAITIGDINGIGPEIIIKTLSDNRILNHLTPVIFGSSKTLSYYQKTFNFHEFTYVQRHEGEEIVKKKVNVINCWSDAVNINVGQVTPEGGNCARLALEASTKALKNNLVDAVVTAPVNKSNLYSEKFQFKGHTSYYASHFNDGENLMMMVSDNLKVGLVTDHIPLKDVATTLTKELIQSKLDVFEKSLRTDFGIGKPKIAVLGLNPHAGEDGILGDEENEIISPAIQEYKNKGMLIFGPFPADGFFGNSDYKGYDGIMGMYHDQVLIPFKSLSFDTGVNYTAGIKIVRTSPDHGTANSIAGKNVASEQSFREALFLAQKIIRNRFEHRKIV